MTEEELKILAAQRKAEFAKKMFNLTGIGSEPAQSFLPQLDMQTLMTTRPPSESERIGVFGDKLKDLFSYKPGDRSYDFFQGVGDYWRKKIEENPIVTEYVNPPKPFVRNPGTPDFDPQRGRGGIPEGMFGVPTIPRGTGTGREDYKPATSRGEQIAGPMSPDALLPTRQMPIAEEEDEFGFLDAMFLSNLIAGTQGGPPPTPYGSAFGGGNKSFVGLPFA